jgi:hypothetical protein
MPMSIVEVLIVGLVVLLAIGAVLGPAQALYGAQVKRQREGRLEAEQGPGRGAVDVDTALGLLQAELRRDVLAVEALARVAGPAMGEQPEASVLDVASDSAGESETQPTRPM